MKKSEYRKGVMLGLTLAEIMLLFLFLLLMILSYLLKNQEDATSSLSAQTKDYRDMINMSDGDIKRQKMLRALIRNSSEIVDVLEHSIVTVPKDDPIGEVEERYKPVEDKEGNTVAYEDEAGNVYSLDGKKIGHKDKKGKLVDDEGEIIGTEVDDKKIIVDEHGHVIGYADKDDKVFDAEGNLIGQVEEDGKVYPIHIDEKNLNRVILGYVSDDKVTDFSGKKIGNVQKNNLAYDFNGTLIGRVGAKAKLVSDDEKIVGYVSALGRVRGDASETVGIMDRYGNVYRTTSKVIANVKDTNSVVFDENNRVIGYVKRNNIVADLKNKEIGALEYTGRAISKTGEWLGHRGQRYKLKRDMYGNVGGYTLLDNNQKLFPVAYYEGKKVYSEDKNSAQLYRKGNKIVAYKKDRKIVSLDGNIEGLYTNDKKLFNKKAEKIGKEAETVSLGYLDKDVVGYEKDGLFYDFNDRKIGVIDFAGDVLELLNEDEKPFDTIEPYYLVKDKNNVLQIQSLSDIEDASSVYYEVNPALKRGKVIGFDDDNGNLVDANKILLGTISNEGIVISHETKKEIASIQRYKALIEVPQQTSDVTKLITTAIDSFEKNSDTSNQLIKLQNEKQILENKNFALEHELNGLKNWKADYLSQLDATARQREEKISELEKKAAAFERENTDLKGWKEAQTKQMQKEDEEKQAKGQKRSGRDRPACWWSSKGNGEYKEDLLFYIRMTDRGVNVYKHIPPNREYDFKKLPRIPLNMNLSLEEFSEYAGHILEWEKAQDCRFRVKICDDIASSKTLYKNTRKVIEKNFYILEDSKCNPPDFMNYDGNRI